MTTRNYVVYYRVSTKRQGDSGLGLEAQREMVARYISNGAWHLVGEYTEVESGTSKGKRPKLRAALADCRLYGATLIIAKLDRLSRSVAEVAKLLEKSSIEFICCDNPHANKTHQQFLSIMAEWEAESISKRTQSALDAKRERGEATGAACWQYVDGDGNPITQSQLSELPAEARGNCGFVTKSGELTFLPYLSVESQAKGRELAAATNRTKADERAALVCDKIAAIKTERGELGPTALARELNRLDIPTPSGRVGTWTARAILNAMAR